MTNSSERFVLELLSNDTFLMVNKSLLRALGDCDEAIVLSELVSAHRMFRDSNKDGWFFQTINYLEQDLGMPYYRQQKAIGALVKKYLIETKRIGMPAMRYFKLHMGNIEALLLDQRIIPIIPVKSKKEFYTGLNEAMTYIEFKAAAGNIKEELTQAMWCWSNHFRAIESQSFRWDAKQFGIFKNWFTTVKKPTDWYYVMTAIKKFLAHASDPSSLFAFVEFAKGVPENPPQNRIYGFKESL